MKVIKIAFKYLKLYPALSGAVLASIIAASLFEGVSFGMIIPLMQSMTGSSNNILNSLPVINRSGFIFSSLDRPGVISVIFIILFLMIVAKNIFIYISNLLIAKLRFLIIRDLNVRLMSKLVGYDLRYFDSMKSGHLITGVTIETMRIGNAMLAIMSFIALMGKVLAYLALIFIISFKISLVILFFMAAVLIPLEFIMRKLKKLGFNVSEATCEYNYKIVEIFSGIRIIKAFATEHSEIDSLKGVADKVYKFSFKSNKYIGLLIPLSETLIFGIVTAAIIFLINVIRVNVTAAFPFITAYLLVLIRLLTQLNALNSQRSTAINNIAAFVNYEELSDERDKKTIINGDKAAVFKNSIEFKAVDFSYARNKPVLTGVDLRVARGRITALVGPSGAGKSTIINLILRFYDVNKGEILVDSIRLKDLDLKDWRRRLGLVSQDIFIFNTSVRENIAYGHGDVGQDAVVEASRKAHAHDFIMALPQQYDTVLGERGVKLSGGQRQRISIARAIIHDPEILILDEATSSLDTETELLIKDAIDRLTKDRTVIAIAHRLSTILHADNIIVLDKGKIVESGRHSDLIKENGLYKRLYSTQFSTQAAG